MKLIALLQVHAGILSSSLLCWVTVVQAQQHRGDSSSSSSLQHHDDISRALDSFVPTPASIQKLSDFCAATGVATEFGAVSCYNSTFVVEETGRCDANGTLEQSHAVLWTCASWANNDAALQYCHECGSAVVCAEDPDPQTSCVATTSSTTASTMTTPRIVNETALLLPCDADETARRYSLSYPCLNDRDYVHRQDTCSGSTSPTSQQQQKSQDIVSASCDDPEQPYCHSCQLFDFCAARPVSCSEVDPPTSAPSQMPSRQTTTTTMDDTTSAAFTKRSGWVVALVLWGIMICGMKLDW